MRTLQLIVLGALLSIAIPGHATDGWDSLNPAHGTAAVAVTGGDSLATTQVSCSSNTLAAGATLLLAAVNAGPSASTYAAGRPQRKRCFQNNTINKVVIGSSTVAASDFFIVGESTSSYSTYCTNNTAAVYCAPAPPITSAQVINVLVESQSIP